MNYDRVRDGQLKEKHGGAPWFDGLIYEMIRGCSDYLAAQRDPALEQRLDGYIERIAAAIRQPGGAEAVQLKVAEKAVEAYSRVAADATTTLIVPSNMTEVSALISSAMKMVQTQKT